MDCSRCTVLGSRGPTHSLLQLADAYLENQPLEKLRKSADEPEGAAKNVNRVDVLTGGTFDSKVSAAAALSAPLS